MSGDTMLWLDENTPLTQSTWNKLQARLGRKDPLSVWGAEFKEPRIDPEASDLQKMLDDAIQQAHVKLSAGLTGVDLGNPGDQTGLLSQPGALPMSGNSAATPKHEQSGAEIMDAITAAFERLKETPIVHAVWFVDCPEKRAKFDAVMSRALVMAADIDTPAQREYVGAFGLPLLDWDSATTTDDEIKEMIRAGNWFIKFKGVWAQMSDRRHRLVEL